MTIIGLDKILVESLRFTAFGNFDFDADTLKSLGIDTVKSSHNLPREQKSIIVADLKENELLVQIQKDQGRMDWILRSNNQPQIMHIGSLDSIYPEFKEKFILWLSSNPPVKRLAYGPIALIDVSNKKDGLDLLQKYLPINIDTENSSDFVFQINSPIIEEIDGEKTTINRVSRWLVIKHMVTKFSLTSTQASSSPSQESFFCRIELDLNNAPTEKYLTRGQVDNLIRVFYEKSLQLLNQGLK